jgi:hypothetical protein
MWGQDPYHVRLSESGSPAVSRVEQGANVFASAIYSPSAILHTGNSSTGYAAIRCTQRGLVWISPGVFGLPSSGFDTQFSVANNNFGTSNNDHKTRIGFVPQSYVDYSTEPTEGMYFEYLGSSNPNWQAVVVGSNSATVVDTGVPVVATGTQIVFRVVYDPVLLQTLFYIAGVLVATIPDSALSAQRGAVTIYAMEVAVIKTTGNAEHLVYVYHHKYSCEKPPLAFY